MRSEVEGEGVKLDTNNAHIIKSSVRNSALVHTPHSSVIRLENAVKDAAKKNENSVEK